MAGLTPDQAAVLKHLQQIQRMSHPNADTWLMHPKRIVHSIAGDIPKLVRQSNPRRYAEMLGEGWYPATQEVLDQHAEFADLPGEVVAEEMARIKTQQAEKAILKYYGGKDEDSVPERWQEKLEKAKAKRAKLDESKASSRKSVEKPKGRPRKNERAAVSESSEKAQAVRGNDSGQSGQAEQQI